MQKYRNVTALQECCDIYVRQVLETPEQPEGEELVVDEVGIALLGKKVLIKKGFDGRHYTAGRP